MDRRIVVLAVALPLTAADLVWKHVAATPTWAYHARGPGWLLLCLGLVAGTLALTPRAPVRLAVAAGVMLGGILGNLVSAAWNGLAVPDPIVIFTQRSVIAFNLADVFISTGTLAVTLVMALTLVRHREELEARRAAALARISRRV